MKLISASWRHREVLPRRDVWREEAPGFIGGVADDGKHALSMIEIDISLLEA